MKNLRKRLIISSIVAALVCTSSAPVDAGVFPWAWNVLFGPANAPWFGPNNGGGYYAGYGPGYYRPAFRARRRRLYRPFAPAFGALAYPAPAYSVPTPYGGCNNGCAPAVSYSPTYSNTLSYSTYVVDSGCNTGCSTGCGIAPSVAPVSNQQYEAERPAAPAMGNDTATDQAPEPNGDGDVGDGESRDNFRAPSSSDSGEDEGAGFMPPVGGDPDPAPPTEPGASRQSVVPVFVSVEGLNESLSDDSARVSTRTLTRDVRSRLAKQRTIRWISAPRNVARR